MSPFHSLRTLLACRLQKGRLSSGRARRGIIETLHSKPQPEKGGEEEGDEDGPGEYVPDPFRNVRLGHLDGDGYFPGDSDDFLFFGDFCRD